MIRRITFFLASALACVVLLINNATAQGIRTSEFNGASLDTFWTFIDPRGGCTQTMTGTHASISMPLGLSRDPVSAGQGGNRAPRIVQRVGPPGSDVGNFGLIAKFDGVQTRQYQIQGIEAIQDDKNYVRCEIYSDSAGLNALLYTFDNNGNYRAQKQHLLPGVPCGTIPLLIRLDRIDSTFSQYYSTNTGGSWIKVDTVTHRISVDSIALYAANSDSIQLPGDTSAPAFVGLVDYFRTDAPLPIQLASFRAKLLNNTHVRLDWTTASEINNYGFEIQKSLGGTQNFQTIPNSFIAGHGTTNEPNSYTYTDVSGNAGEWYFRLKQIDLDGTIHYFEPIQMSVPTDVDEKETPTVFALKQNYPNPFNPSTIIKYEVPKQTHVKLEIFNPLGQKVATLVDEVKSVGAHEHTFNADNLTSGVYMYRLVADGSWFTRKMVLIK